LLGELRECIGQVGESKKEKVEKKTLEKEKGKREKKEKRK